MHLKSRTRARARVRPTQAALPLGLPSVTRKSSGEAVHSVTVAEVMADTSGHHPSGHRSWLTAAALSARVTGPQGLGRLRKGDYL